jgi:hypothetical protein
MTESETSLSNMKYEIREKGGKRGGRGEKNLISSQLRDEMKLTLKLGENFIFFLLSIPPILIDIIIMKGRKRKGRGCFYSSTMDINHATTLKKIKQAAPRVPKRSPIQVLSWPNVAQL